MPNGGEINTASSFDLFSYPRTDLEFRSGLIEIITLQEKHLNFDIDPAETVGPLSSEASGSPSLVELLC